MQSLLRPVLECLRRELVAQYSIGDLQRSLSLRDRDLELLLGATPDEPGQGDSADDLAQLVQGCVDHLGCAVGALLIPDKNIAVCRTGQGTPPRDGAAVLTRAHRPLLAWTQLHRQTLTANRPAETASARSRALQAAVVPGDARRRSACSACSRCSSRRRRRTSTCARCASSSCWRAASPTSC